MTEEKQEAPRPPDPEMTMVKVKEDAKAQITVNDGESIECSRNVMMLAAKLAEMNLKDDDKVKIDLPAMDPQDEAKTVVVTIYAGTYSVVKEDLARRTVTAEEAIIAVRRFLTELGEFSYLKGIMVSAVFGDAGVGGFSMLNNQVDLEDGDMIMLHESAAGQAEVFKSTLQKKGVKFPGDDDSGLILPGGGPIPRIGG